MSTQSIQTSAIITVSQFGGNWYCFQVNSPKDTRFIGNEYESYKAAETAAIQFATKNDLPFIANYLSFKKPVVTIWKEFDSWLPAKIFQDRIVGAGILREHKQQALDQAKQIAKNEDLDFVPSIGESIFDKK